ncbi:hypothetical protein JNUCC0626_40205 [Lentzea sp. JNUCC 0626]|uniref:hypothetical protein n=1 Tax=Lentzea sp. JNUCC 0626 TaxID=3367513 RepID=UPI003748B735
MTTTEPSSSLAALAHLFGDHATASGAGSAFSCEQADLIAGALIELGDVRAAVRWLVGHAEGDDYEHDSHAYFFVGLLSPSQVDQHALGYIVENLL